MEHLEEIRSYIERTHIAESTYRRYCLYLKDINALYEYLNSNAFDALRAAFDYGMAKGYRAAKAAKHG